MLRTNFNKNWTFKNLSRDGIEQIVNLPHDAMQTEKRIPKMKNGSATGYYPGGKYMYTKTLFGEEDYLGKTVLLEFEGIYMKSRILLNNEEIGGWVYGYTDFIVDLTGRLRIGQDNEINVIVDNSQTPNSRWYSGSGIYRNVNLLLGNRSFIRPNGVKIITRSVKPAVLQVDIEAVNAHNMEITTEIIRDGKVVAVAVGANCQIQVPDVLLWDAENPNLYDVRIQLLDHGKPIDEAHERIGIRKLEWNPQNGLVINGNMVKLRGGCIHNDNGPLGAATFSKSEFRRIKILKEAGFNAIRCAHNPASRALLDACDELGMYVMEESFDSWFAKKSDYDYTLYFYDNWAKDLEAMVRKDYNHPSVIMYAIGNEIMESSLTEGIKYTKDMVEFCHRLDDSRPVINCVNLLGNVLMSKGMSALNKTQTSKDDVVDPYREVADSKASGSAFVNMMITLMPFLNKHLANPKRSAKATEGTFAEVDIAGYNYGSHTYSKHLEQYPDRIIVGSETFPQDIADNWNLVSKDSRIIGDFMWTAWDYLGEAGVGYPLYGVKRGAFSKPYPVVSGGCGAIDMTGFIDTPAYNAAIVWGVYQKPYIGVRPLNHAGEKYFFGQWRGTDAVNSWSWTGMAGRQAEIEVYSIGKSLELFQDGRSLGRKPLTNFLAKYTTVYQPGTLMAVSYDEDDKEIGRSILQSAGNETILTVIAEDQSIKADGEDLAYINVAITDKNGIVKMLTDHQVKIRVEGAGHLAAVGSGNPATTEDFTGDKYTTYNGRMIAIVRSSGQLGKITVTAEVDGLPSQSIFIEAK